MLNTVMCERAARDIAIVRALVRARFDFTFVRAAGE